MLACSLVTRTCLKTTRGLISGMFRWLTLEVLSPEKTIALLFENYFKFLMTLLAGLFEMRECWHIGLRWAIVALWATCSLLFLIGSLWYFHVTRTSIKAWMSSNFCQIKSLQEFDFWHIQTADIVELIGPEKTIALLLENYSKYFNDFTWWLSG